MALVRDWRAVRTTGERLERREIRPVDVPGLFLGVERVAAETDHREMPLVRVVIDPAKGDKAGIPHTRRSITLDGAAEPTGIPAFEISPGPGRIVRLELHPDGPVLVTAARLEF